VTEAEASGAPGRRSISELTTQDPTTAMFGPPGLMTSAAMTPDASADYLQAMTEGSQLGKRVPGEVRRSFERIRDLHAYGVFSYGFFTLAEGDTWLLPEAALGVRFIEHYAGRVPFERGDEQDCLKTSSFRTVVETVGAGGRFATKPRWHLAGHGPDATGRYFNGSYGALMRWAYQEGLLANWLNDGWQAAEARIRYAVITHVSARYGTPDTWNEMDDGARALWWEEWRRDVWEQDQMSNLVVLRNVIAHAPPGNIVMPADSARAIASAAAFINALWSRPFDRVAS
jgi:hypothetical protein